MLGYVCKVGQVWKAAKQRLAAVGSCSRVAEQLFVLSRDYFDQVLHVFQQFWHLFVWFKVLH